MKDVDMLLFYGGAVKTLGQGKVGGYLVRFGSPIETDLEADYFTSETDFDTEFPGKATVYYNHALDNTLKGRKLGKGDLTTDEIGVWIEAQLSLRDDYEKAIYKMAEEGKLGWSSGTASHLVERKSVQHSSHILRWPLGLDASLTPTPAEPRNNAFTLKSWLEGEAGEDRTLSSTSFSSLHTEREFERFLRDAGCSRSLAVAITQHGFKSALQRESEDDQRDAVEPVHDRVLAHVRALEARLRTGDFHESHASVQGAGTPERP